ncbi:MAG: MmcQ/YjbR family DNA-binding protein [Candidatus Acidiferrales bacterium]
MALTFKDARKMALSLDGVEESTSYGTAAFKIRGKLIARLKEDGESLVVGTTFEEREEMMRADPETYYITDHYLNYPWVLVRLPKVHPDAMRDLLKGAVRLAARAKRGSTKRATRHSKAGRSENF